MLDGLAGIVEYVMESFLDMAELGESVGDLLRGIAEAIAGTAE